MVRYRTTPVVLLGDVALQYILGRRGVTRHRGGVYDWDGRMVMVTIHPAALMRNPSMWSVVVSDLEYARNMTHRHSPLPREFVTRPTRAQVEEWFSHRAPVYFPDIETSGNALLCVGVAADEVHAICVPFWDGMAWYWTNEDDALAVVGTLAEFFADASRPKVFQNGTFDVNVLESFGFAVNGWVADTMLMHHTVYSEMPHSLAFLHSVYVREPYYKWMRLGDKDAEEEDV